MNPPKQELNDLQKKEIKEIGISFFKYYTRYFYVLGYGNKKENKDLQNILVQEYTKKNKTSFLKKGKPFYMKNPKKVVILERFEIIK